MTRTYTNPTLDRSMWPAGPWDNEPDKISWTDAQTDMPCLIVRNDLGSLCGYVAVERGHPLYGKDYDDVENVDVHGGLTYADPCRGGSEESAVCHIPEPGKSDDVWWLGFDCAHAWDITPAIAGMFAARNIPKREFPDTSYKTVGFVTAECASLAQQLKAMPPESTNWPDAATWLAASADSTDTPAGASGGIWVNAESTPPPGYRKTDRCRTSYMFGVGRLTRRHLLWNLAEMRMHGLEVTAEVISDGPLYTDYAIKVEGSERLVNAANEFFAGMMESRKD